MRPTSLSPRATAGIVAATALLGISLAQLPTAFGASSAPAPPQAGAAQSSGSCVALRRSANGKKYSPVTARVYKYKFVRKKGGGFRRVIVRVKAKVKVSCARQCVVTVKRKGKYRPVYVTKRVKIKVRKRNRIVTVKRRKRVYKYGKCPAGATGEDLGTPVKIELLAGSYALLDFGAFQRQAAVSGTLRGFIPGKIQLNADIQITLNKGTLTLAQTAVFIDDECNGQVSSAIRTGNPTTISLDPTRTSTSTLLKSGTATALAYTKIRLPLELRNGDFGCGRPYISTGYREFDQTFFLRGRVGAGGLTKLQLTSAPDTLDVEACLSPGAPSQPCNGFAIPLPILVSTKLIVNVDLSGK